MADEIVIYALSTCPWCHKTKQWFVDSNVEFECIEVDGLPDDEQDTVAEKAHELSGGRRFPVTVVNGAVIVGYNPGKFLEHLKGKEG